MLAVAYLLVTCFATALPALFRLTGATLPVDSSLLVLHWGAFTVLAVGKAVVAALLRE